MIEEIKKEIYGNPFWIGENPNNFDYGMAFLISHLIWLVLVITSPIWGILYLLGKISKPRGER